MSLARGWTPLRLRPPDPWQVVYERTPRAVTQGVLEPCALGGYGGVCENNQYQVSRFVCCRATFLRYRTGPLNGDLRQEVERARSLVARWQRPQDQGRQQQSPTRQAPGDSRSEELPTGSRLLRPVGSHSFPSLRCHRKSETQETDLTDGHVAVGDGRSASERSRRLSMRETREPQSWTRRNPLFNSKSPDPVLGGRGLV